MLALLPCLLLAVAAPPSPAWSMVVEKDGVRVSQRPGQRADLLQFRAEATVESPIAQVVAVLLDFEHRPEWVANCASSTVLERPQPNVAVVYSYTKSPPLVADRDVVFEASATVQPADHSVELRFRGVQHPKKPPLDGVARISVLEGFYRARQLTPERTEVIYEFLADPGGSIPSWLVNLAGKEGPYKTLLGLREQAARPAPASLAAMQSRLQWRGFAD